MHVLHHLAGRELLTKLPVSGDQIFHLVEEKVLRTVEEIKGVGCPVVEFEWSRKHADSLITKLLAKKESIAADVYDNLRFRMITNTEEQLVFVLRELTEAARPLQLRHPGSVGERHRQDSRDARRARRRCSGSCRRSPTSRRSRPTRSRRRRTSSRGPATGSSTSWPTCRCASTSTFAARPTIRSSPSTARIVFVLTEFQIIDARTAENNERGENSHDKYKERQAARVKARLMHGMKDDGLGD